MKTAAYDALAQSKILSDYEAAFRQATGFSLEVVPSTAPTRRLSLGAHENPFCALVAQSQGGCEVCLKTQAEALKRLDRKFSPQTIRCFAGLTDVAVPIVVSGQHVATLFSGQVLREKPARRQFARLTRQLVEWGLQTDLHRVEEAYFQTRVVNDQQFKAIVRLLTIFAQHLADFANQLMITRRVGEPSSVRRAKEFVREHATEKVSMRQAAEHVHLSAYYFCKMFKKTTGMTFTEYVSRMRVEKAKNLLLNPNKWIHEVAYDAGFQSIPHFNRVFKKYTGVSPTEHRAHLRA